MLDIIRSNYTLLPSDVEKRKNPVCGFVTPLEGSEAEAHRKPEVSHPNAFFMMITLTPRASFAELWFSLALGLQAIILEGSYWKRRIEVVIKEYHKWRIYYKKRVRIHLFCSVYLT